MADKDDKDKYKKTMNLFFKCNRLHHTLAECRVSSLGLHRSQRSLMLIVSFYNNISQKELAKKLEISPAAVTVTLKKLETQGYIARASSVKDSRVNNIAITDKGRHVIDKTSEIFDELDKQTFKGFSDDDLDNLHRYLKQISENLQGVCEESKSK